MVIYIDITKKILNLPLKITKKNTTTMKKIFFAVFALVMSINAHAFEFDGIDLNGNIADITKQVSAKGYAYDDVKNGLVGNCQGTDIVLHFNYEKVSKQGKLGQLIVEIPMKESNALDVIVKTFNVVYHLKNKVENSYTYVVSNDGTTVTVSNNNGLISLTYNTPYYKA